MKCDNPSGALEMFDIVLNEKPDHALALDCAAHCCFLTGTDKRGRELAKKLTNLELRTLTETGVLGNT